MTNHPGIRAALMAAAGTLALTAAACGAKGTASGPDANTTPNANTTVSATASAGSGEGDPATVGGTGGTTTATTKPPTPKSSTAPKSSSATGPVIVSFKVTQQPVCERVATADAPFQPAKDIIVAWKVTGATKVALSMDGGLYGGDYGPEGQQQLYFACKSGDPHPSHTYTITTSGGGASKSQTLTVTISQTP